MIPHAGGPSAYARRALGPFFGYITGISCLMEFLFAPPAIAIAVGWYINFLVPVVPQMAATVFAIILFVFINFRGMHTSAVFELVVTVIALVGLVIFWAFAVPHFSTAMWLQPLAQPNGLDGFLALIPNGWAGVMASVPFAIWFYLALEGGAMSAEEMIDPQKDIPKGFLTGMATLFVMMCLTVVLTAGIADYNIITAVDFPLPIALAQIFGEKSAITVAVNVIGLFGLIASLNGIIVGSSRQMYAMARTGYLPKFLAAVNPKHHTPHWALITAGAICLIAALTGLTAVVISISVIGSVMLYFCSLIAFFVLRVKEPDLNRPFKVKYGMLVGGIAMAMCLFCIVAVFGYALNNTVLIVTGALYAVSVAWYFVAGKNNIRPFEEEFGVLDDIA